MPQQQWLANYIGSRTPYKGILVYHETGTGKTCTAISIAENFREELKKSNKKIIVLVSDNVKDQFYKTIANTGSSLKCTGNTYNKMLPKHKPHTQKNLNQRLLQFH